MGFGAKTEDSEEKQERQQEQIQSAIKRNLRPELINRLSSIVPFQPLRPEHIRQIVEKCVSALNVRLAERQITLFLSPEVTEMIAKEGFSQEFGARELERTFERLVSKLLAEAILAGGIATGEVVVAERKCGKVIFRKTG